MIRHAVNVVRSLVHEARKRSERSPHWPAVEHAYRKAHPACAACGGAKRLQIHHVAPFHLHPERELDPDNLISLCMGPSECHLEIGHGGNFKAYNPNVRRDAAIALTDPAKFSSVVLAARAAALR